MFDKRYWRLLYLVIAGHFFLGMAHISILPLWEGFDETVHFSYVQQLGDTGTLPRPRIAKQSQDVFRYMGSAPGLYRARARSDYISYRSFFAADPAIQERGRSMVHERPDVQRRYSPSSVKNWVAQHPPLYYGIMLPVYKLTNHLSWGSHIFTLRIVSYLLAWISLCVGVHVCFLCNKPWPALGITLWPLFFPSWFPEMARMGQDSLCALLTALLALITVRFWATGKPNLRSFSLLAGCVLGLGALTKAFFVPISLGFFGYWIFNLAESHRNTSGRKETAKAVTLALGVIGMIVGWWYILNWIQIGVATGMDHLMLVDSEGGIWKGLQSNFSVFKLVRSHIGFLSTLGWSGTMSMARPSYIFLAPMAFLPIFLTFIYLRACRSNDRHIFTFFPLWIAIPVLAGFSSHILVMMALTGTAAGTSGYYLNVLVVPLGIGLGLGLESIRGNPLLRIFAACSFAYSLIFGLGVTISQVLLFGGVFYLTDASKFFQIPESLPPFLGIPLAMERLDAIAFPALALSSFGVGVIVVIVGLSKLVRILVQVETRKEAPGL